jgi:hypothetical protein
LDVPSDMVSAWQGRCRLPLPAPASRTCPRHHQSLKDGFREYDVTYNIL